MNNYHIFKYYINAAHSVDNQIEHSHTHTFTVAFWIEHPDGKENLPFGDVDKMMEEYLQGFRGKYLNAEPDFAGLSPTLENFCEVLYEKMGKKLEERGLKLLKTEVCENPLRVYSVSNEILLPSAYAGQMDRNWEKIVAMKQSDFAKAEPERSSL